MRTMKLLSRATYSFQKLHELKAQFECPEALSAHGLEHAVYCEFQRGLGIFAGA